MLPAGEAQEGLQSACGRAAGELRRHFSRCVDGDRILSVATGDGRCQLETQRGRQHLECGAHDLLVTEGVAEAARQLIEERELLGARLCAAAVRRGCGTAGCCFAKGGSQLQGQRPCRGAVAFVQLWRDEA